MCWGASTSETADHTRRQDSKRLWGNRLLGLDRGSTEDEIKQHWPITRAPSHLSRTPLPSRAARGMANSSHCCNEAYILKIFPTVKANRSHALHINLTQPTKSMRTITRADNTRTDTLETLICIHTQTRVHDNMHTAPTGFGLFSIQSLRYTGYKRTHGFHKCVNKPVFSFHTSEHS